MIGRTTNPAIETPLQTTTLTATPFGYTNQSRRAKEKAYSSSGSVQHRFFFHQKKNIRKKIFRLENRLYTLKPTKKASWKFFEKSTILEIFNILCFFLSISFFRIKTEFSPLSSNFSSLLTTYSDSALNSL